MAYTNPQHLISTEELAGAMSQNAENLKIFDVTVTLVPNPPGYKAVSGIEDYGQGHIPGAAFMDLGRDLSDTTSGFGFTLPSAEHLQAAYRAAGVNDDSQVVFYSSGHMMWATRAWWMLYSCGHKNVAVLDGGLGKWKSEGRALATEAGSYEPGQMNVNLDADRWVNKAQTAAAVEDGDVCTINALAPGVYSGDADMHYGRRGHIENSKNLYYDTMMEAGCFKPAAEIKQLFEEKGVLQKPKVIAYCGGGISATIDAMALTLIGHENVAIYDGSMSEWVKDESLPLITGS
ncbi:MAG: thiosulfate/3-mercaptopyruvate sulfurtransferase [Candidatus Azotimanducaceae bacterium]|jgi:thiosulfate/3-mercaptopyruvate sulfurtransferase